MIIAQSLSNPTLIFVICVRKSSVQLKAILLALFKILLSLEIALVNTEDTEVLEVVSFKNGWASFKHA